MTFLTASGLLAIVVCLGLLIFGFKKGFPWFIIETALVNGAMAVLCLYLLIIIIANLDGGLAVALSVIVVGFGAICCINLHRYLSGKESERFNQVVQERFRERLRRGRQ